MAFHVGQEVVCIVGTWSHHDPEFVNKIALPQAGVVYHIRDFPETHCCPECDAKTWIRLEEIVNLLGNGAEAIFDAEGFRPVYKTDISIFTAMLNPTPKPKTVRKTRSKQKA